MDQRLWCEVGLGSLGHVLGSNGLDVLYANVTRIEPDSQGRLQSETAQLFFAPSEDRRTVRVGNAASGEWLLTGSEEQAARKAAEERARQAEAENARLRAELERFKKAGQ